MEALVRVIWLDHILFTNIRVTLEPYLNEVLKAVQEYGVCESNSVHELTKEIKGFRDLSMDIHDGIVMNQLAGMSDRVAVLEQDNEEESQELLNTLFATEFQASVALLRYLESPVNQALNFEYEKWGAWPPWVRWQISFQSAEIFGIYRFFRSKLIQYPLSLRMSSAQLGNLGSGEDRDEVERRLGHMPATVDQWTTDMQTVRGPRWVNVDGDEQAYVYTQQNEEMTWEYHENCKRYAGPPRAEKSPPKLSFLHGGCGHDHPGSGPDKARVYEVMKGGVKWNGRAKASSI